MHAAAWAAVFFYFILFLQNKKSQLPETTATLVARKAPRNEMRAGDQIFQTRSGLITVQAIIKPRQRKTAALAKVSLKLRTGILLFARSLSKHQHQRAAAAGPVINAAKPQSKCPTGP